jgi:hypothetical protein
MHLPSSVDSEACLYADDTKIFRIIDNLRDPEILQDDLKQLEKWSENWLLKFHPEKCKHIHMHNPDGILPWICKEVEKYPPLNI